MADYTVIIAAVCWLALLWAGVTLTRLKHQPWAFVAHVASGIALLGPLTTVMGWLKFDDEHIGLWVLLVVPAAAVINLVLIVFAGNVRPHCKACGHGRFTTVNTADGDKEHCSNCQTPKGER